MQFQHNHSARDPDYLIAGTIHPHFKCFRFGEEVGSRGAENKRIDRQLDPMLSKGSARPLCRMHAFASQAATSDSFRSIAFLRSIRLPLSARSTEPQMACDCRAMFVIRRVPSPEVMRRKAPGPRSRLNEAQR